MVRGIISSALLLAFLIILIGVGTRNSTALLTGQAGLQARSLEGIFGRVTSIITPISAPGLTVISLDTNEGLVELQAAENTVVIIPGKERSSAADISLGDFLAVLARADDSLRALSILVKPDAPVIHTHITGPVVGGTEGEVIIMDRDGNVVLADLPLEGAGPDSAQVLTSVLRQDLKTGRVSILGSETAEAKIGRLRRALEDAIGIGAKENQANLEERLRTNTTGHLSTLQEVVYRADPSLTFIFAQTMVSVLQTHEVDLATFDLGVPTIRLSGVIQDIDRTRGIAFVSLREGPQIQLKLTARPTIQRFGTIASVANLEGGQRIEFLYDPQSGEAEEIDVIFPTLADNLATGLLSQALVGELEGTVNEFDFTSSPPTIVIRLATGKTVTLTTTPKTRVRISAQSAEVQGLVLGVPVKARYDPTTMEALDIETFDVRPRETFLSGIVKSFIPKIRAGIRIPGSAEEGNISIISLTGETLTLNITDSTVIKRDGLRMNIAAIKLGDLVRPTSHYNTETAEVQKLTLRASTLKGTLRGKVITPDGRHYLTISTDKFDLITVAVTASTELIESDEIVDFEALKAGERVVSGLYNPRTLQASQLILRPPKTLRTLGPISDLDQENGIVTITPSVGEPIILLIPNKPGIVFVGGHPKSTNDLKVGDEVLVAFYRPDKVVVRMVTRSK